MNQTTENMKDGITQWSEGAFNTLEHFWATIASFAPRIIGGIILLVLGWLIAKVVSNLVKKLFNSSRFKKLTKAFDESKMVEGVDIDLSLAAIVSKFVYWVIMILFLIIISDNMGWSEVSKEIGSLFRYLPRLFIAIIIFVIGMYIAGVIRQLLKASLNSMSFGGAPIVSSVVYYIILIIITVTALNQAGVGTDVVSSNLSIILGSVLLAFAIGFGLASKDVIRKMLFSYYSNQCFEVGQKIASGSVEGTIVKMNNMSVFVQTHSDIEIIPIDLLMSQNAKIISSPSE